MNDLCVIKIKKALLKKVSKFRYRYKKHDVADYDGLV